MKLNKLTVSFEEQDMNFLKEFGIFKASSIVWKHYKKYKTPFVSPIVNNSIFASTPSKESIVSKAFETYSVQFGQNFITGKPFNMGIEVRANKSNIAFMGSDVEVVRDMMG